MPLSPIAALAIAGLLGASLVPSVDDERLDRERTVGGEIAKTLELVPGVTAARVHVRLAERGLLARGAAEPGAVAVVRFSEPRPDEAQLREILAAAVPGAEASAIEVVLVPDPSAAAIELARVGPIEVTRATAGLARAIFIAALIAIVVLAAGLIFAGLRLRRERKHS
jgi:type III secretory pathway lipoprotein EscJ